MGRSPNPTIASGRELHPGVRTCMSLDADKLAVLCLLTQLM